MNLSMRSARCSPRSKSWFHRVSSVSFATNLRDDESSQRAYYETQFNWCPMILSDDISRNDHILYYRSATAIDSISPAIMIGDTLYQRAGNGYTLLLMHKIKTK
jgi:hypothetical protein